MFIRRKLGRAIAAADRARDRRDWTAAAAAYRTALDLDPGRIGIWIQYGHALKELGALGLAEEAYRRAAALAPGHADAWLQIGHVCKQLERPDDAFVAFMHAIDADPQLRSAQDELLNLGGRDALGGAVGLRRAREFARLRPSLDRAIDALARWADAAPEAAGDYGAFRSAHPVPPPPGRSAVQFSVRIDARAALPAEVRATLLSLRDQSLTEWRATVTAPHDLAEHPVGSLAHVDDRIGFEDSAVQHPDAADTGIVLLLDAGTTLDPQALAWFGFVAERTGAAALYCDHDATLPHWRDGGTRFAPRLYPMFDCFFFAATDEPPVVVAIAPATGAALPNSGSLSGAETRRAHLLDAAGRGAVAHVPRVLASRQLLPKAAAEGPDLPPPPPAQPQGWPAPLSDTSAERLSVIIPTRDAAALLRSCVESLRGKAAAPALLDVLIVDNRSGDRETLALLEQWEREGAARRVAMDEPFNWSRANNLAVAQSTAPLLLFANNDMEMLTDGWDAILRRALADEAVGALGGRLLYPDRTIQHAGVLFGIGQGSPIHEGVGAPEDDPGPLARWHVRRSVPAITGAFLAVRRSVFDLVGGFDELALPIGFNDIDFCLGVRAHGLRILYEPAIALTHFESVTRGRNDTAAKLAWDHGELESFHARWGDEIFVDPGYNPHWTPAGPPFDGYREPRLNLLLDHIDRAAMADPWGVIRPPK